MGKKSAKNRNTNSKKKQPSPTANSPVFSSQFTKLQNLSSQNSKLSQLSIIISKALQDLLNSFRLQLVSADASYDLKITYPPLEKQNKLDDVLTEIIIEFTEELYKYVKYSQNISVFLIESYKCLQSAASLLNPISDSQALQKLTKLIFFNKILKLVFTLPAQEKFSPEVKTLHSELSDFCAVFKINDLLPLEKLVKFFCENKSCKEFLKNCQDLSAQSRVTVDSEVEELASRLERCEKVENRNKPLVSQEWISLLRKQLSLKQ